MSTRRISERAGWIEPKKRPRGPNGRGLCRWCNTEVPKGRRTFCGDECVHQHKLRTNPGYVRDELFKRDVGVCQLCRADTEALRHTVRKGMWSDTPNIMDYPQGAQEAFARLEGESYDARRRRIGLALGIPEKFLGLELSRSWWEADHIVPVVEGGGECGLEGYRTLCVPCHRDVTRELRKRLARRRQDGPGQAKAADPAQDQGQAPKTPGSPGSGHAEPRARPVRTPVGAAGVRHDSVSPVRRTGPDAQVQDRVPAVPGTRGDL